MHFNRWSEEKKREGARKAGNVEALGSTVLGLHITFYWTSHSSWRQILSASQFESFLSEVEKVGKFLKVISLLELEIKFSFDSKSHRLPTTPLFF